jgi:hypothetical protein
VIGRRASKVDAADTLDYMFGYVPLLDITLRGREDRSFRKSFDTFTGGRMAAPAHRAGRDGGVRRSRATPPAPSRQTRDRLCRGGAGCSR